MECNNCGSSDFTELYSDSYGGYKGSSRRNETERTIYRCKDCEKEGRKFEDGVDGGVQYTGVLRE